MSESPGNNRLRLVAPVQGLKFLGSCLRPYPWALTGGILSLLVTSACELGLGRSLSGVVDNSFSQASNGAFDRSFQILTAVVVVFAVGVFWKRYLIEWLGERVGADIRNKLYDHLIGLDQQFFESNRTGELLSRLTGDITQLQSVIPNHGATAIKCVSLLIGGEILLLITNFKLALLITLMVPLGVIPISKFGRWVRRLSRANQDATARAIEKAEETLAAAGTVRACCRIEDERHSFRERVEASFSAGKRRALVMAGLSGICVCFGLLLIVGVLFVCSRDLTSGRVTPGELTAFVFYSIVLAAALATFSEVWSQLQKASGAAERIVELLDKQPRVLPPAVPVSFSRPLRGEVVFRDVCFSYPTRPDRPALNDFTLTVSEGENIALVGPSGGGKSTALAMLLRFFDPQQGDVYIDGINTRDLELNDLRSQISLVPQTPDLFATTIAENIRYGRPDATDEEVHAAAVDACAFEFIEQLEDGFLTEIGERGVRLSGGQRQRIALARAILRDSPILLLDEATSALDAKSERYVQEALKAAMRHRTALVIAHRLATVVEADRIVVVDGGRIIASGTHEELLATSELYAHLAHLQFQQPVGVKS